MRQFLSLCLCVSVVHLMAPAAGGFETRPYKYERRRVPLPHALSRYFASKAVTSSNPISALKSLNG